MPLIFPELRRASFAGIVFPVTKVTRHGATKLAEHEFFRQPGSLIQRGGRKPYVVEMRSVFCDSLLQYPDLYPVNLGQLERAFEQELVDELVVPGKGTIQALCSEWTADMTGKYINGEEVMFKFIEITDQEFSVKELIQFKATSFSDKVQSFKQLADTLTNKPSIFDQITELANQIQAFLDFPELAFSLIVAKVQQLTNLLDRADSSLQELQDPENFDLTDSLYELWASTQSLVNTLLNGASIQSITTSVKMTLQDVSLQIYGDVEHDRDLLGLNDIQDPFDIPPGTTIKYIL